MSKHLFTVAALAAAALPVHASIGITSPASVYGQTFDTLATTGTTNAWANDSTMPGWELYTAALAAVATYRAGDGASNTGAIYSYGTTSTTERALGSVGSGGFSGYIAVGFTNASAGAFNSFTLGFDGEQWRNGGNTSAQTMMLEYGFGASFGAVSTWTAPGGSFDFVSPVMGSTGAAVDGNVAGKVSGLGGTVVTTWAPGSTLWVRWVETNNTGNDHGLAIDNLRFTVTAVPEPGTLAMLLAGLGAVGLVIRRRA